MSRFLLRYILQFFDKNIKCINNNYNENELIILKCKLCNCVWSCEFNKLINKHKKIKCPNKICKTTNQNKITTMGHTSLGRTSQGGNIVSSCSYEQSGQSPLLARTKKYTIDFINEYVKYKNLVCLSNEYKNNKVRLTWKCIICNYEWESGFANIKNLNSGCPNCINHVRHTIEDVREFTKNKSFLCLSNLYNNNYEKLTWICKICGNIWDAPFNNIKNHNVGCNKCSSTALNIHIVKKFIKKKYNMFIFK